MRKNKYCDHETVFEHIWDHADGEGLWEGGAASIAADFGATEDVADDALGELCDRGMIEQLYRGKFAIVKWLEKDDPRSCSNRSAMRIEPSMAKRLFFRFERITLMLPASCV
jgi:hypothetical protein